MRFTYISHILPATYEISFFVPCLNEAGNVGLTLANICQAAREIKTTFEILVFDDASTDSTREEVKRFAIQHPDIHIRLIANQRRRGLARNYVDGAHLAQGKYYMLVNGDNAEPVETIKSIIAEKGQADIIIPIFKGNDQRTPFRRKLSLTFTTIINFLSNNKIGYYNGPALHHRFNVMRWHADTDGFAYQAEIITRLIQEGATFKEVVVANTDRVLGASSALNLKNLLAVTHSMTQIWLRQLRHFLFYKNSELPREAEVTDFRRGI